jgi:hypothetical protein
MDAIFIKAKVSDEGSEYLRGILQKVEYGARYVPDSLKVMARIAVLNLNLPEMEPSMTASEFAERRAADALRERLTKDLVPRELGAAAILDPKARLTKNGLMVVGGTPDEELLRLRKEIAETYHAMMGHPALDDQMGRVEVVIPPEITSSLVSVTSRQMSHDMLPTDAYRAAYFSVADTVNEGLKDLRDSGETITIQGRTQIERVRVKTI